MFMYKKGLRNSERKVYKNTVYFENYLVTYTKREMILKKSK